MLPMERWRAGFDERYPIYQQIVNRFCHSLVKQELSTGERIPSIRDMSLALKVNTNTVQRAYQEMERGGMIYSQRGTGYFVMQDDGMIERVKHDMVREAAMQFLAEMHELGFENRDILTELERQMKGAETHADANQGA